jgi:hypothetical protein
MSPQWAQACAAAANAWPPPDRRAAKLDEFWNWIDMVRPGVNGRLALSVRGGSPAGLGGATLLVDLSGGAVTEASVAVGRHAEDDAGFVLAGSYADWLLLLEGYDVGKVVMYRKLMLEKGDTLQFFAAAYFWTELLAAIQSVPVEVPALR